MSEDFYRTYSHLVGKYPRHTEDFADIEACAEKFVLDGYVPERPLIGPTSRVRTQGSCFAKNMAIALDKAGAISGFLDVREYVNTPRHNADIIERIRHIVRAETNIPEDPWDLVEAGQDLLIRPEEAVEWGIAHRIGDFQPPPGTKLFSL